MRALALILASLLMLAGVAGVVLPGLPGIPLVLLGVIVYGLFEGFKTVGGSFLLLMLALTALGLAVEYLGAAAGARSFGASRWGVVGALVGGMLGLLLAGPFGLLFGPLLGAIAAEFLRGAPAPAAVKAGAGTVLGLITGSLLKLAIAVAMVFLFVAKVT